MTAILELPCSSKAILSASSISRVPKPWLELCWVPGGHRNDAAVHMELSDNRTAPLKLRPVALLRELPEPEEADEDVLLWVFVAEEGFPTPIGCVVPPHQFNLIRPPC